LIDILAFMTSWYFMHDVVPVEFPIRNLWLRMLEHPPFLEIHGVIFYFSFTNLCQTKERISNWRFTLGLEKSTLEDLSVGNMAKPL